MAITLIAGIKQANNGTFALVDSNDIHGGLYHVDLLTEIQNIPLERIKDGMLCYVSETKLYYKCNATVNKDEFIDSVATLKSYQNEESKTSKTKFPLVYGIVSLYTTYILEEPIHPVGTPFPGSLKVIEKDGVFYCPVKEANLEAPNAVCKMCIAEQLEF